MTGRFSKRKYGDDKFIENFITAKIYYEMKKLKLNLKDVGEILTREQLKQVSGGSGGGSGF